MIKNDVPIFPLSSITFPGGYMPLRIFEPRYLDMVKNCVKNNTGFGISLTKIDRISFMRLEHIAKLQIGSKCMTAF